MSQCAICDQYGTSVYSDVTEDFYCKECYEKFKSQINCDCEGEKNEQKD